jgi:hypothetical protein
VVLSPVHVWVCGPERPDVRCFAVALADVDITLCRHYTSNGENPPHGDFEPGMEDMPAVLAAYQAIGREIISGELRAIDFGRFGLR